MYSLEEFKRYVGRKGIVHAWRHISPELLSFELPSLSNDEEEAVRTIREFLETA